MKVLSANASHINQLAALHQEAMTILAQSDPRFSAQVHNSVDWTSIIESRTQTILVAIVDDSVVGYICGVVHDNTGQMIELVLDAHRYHGGSGRILWQALRDWFTEQQVTQNYVRVPRYQAVTQAFWRALGAKPLDATLCPENLEPLPAGMIWMTL